MSHPKGGAVVSFALSLATSLHPGSQIITYVDEKIVRSLLTELGFGTFLVPAVSVPAVSVVWILRSSKID